MTDMRQLLIVEDDEAFARTLTRSFERRGYEVRHARSFEEMEALLPGYEAGNAPGYAVVDLKLNGASSGLACVQLLHQHNPAALIVVLTGFASFLSALTASITALSIPRLRSIGFMPAATAFTPSCAIACARTVAVVVPSPA